METFAEVRHHILENHTLFMDEPFQLAFDCPWPMVTERRQFSLLN